MEKAENEYSGNENEIEKVRVGRARDQYSILMFARAQLKCCPRGSFAFSYIIYGIRRT